MNYQNKQTVFWKADKTRLLLFLFLVLGLSIRIYNLGSHNLWFDEFWSLRIVREFSFMDRDYNPPLYYILLSFWVRYFGPFLAKYFGGGEFILRSLSMIFGVISIPFIYKLGKLFFDTKTGLISAFILSVSPIHIWYSQEARGYSLSTFLIMLIVYFFIMALKKRTIYLWMGFVISSILALYINYFSFFIIILVGILFLSKTYRPLFKYYLVSLCFILILFLPLLPFIFQKIPRVKYTFSLWIPKPHLNSIVITFENFNVGYNATPWIYFFSFIVFYFLFIFGIQYWWKEKRQELISLISFIFIPVIITFLISKKMPIYLDRQIMLFSPFYYIIIATGLVSIRMRSIKIAAYLSICLSIVFCLHNYFSYRMPLPYSHHIGVHVKKPVKPVADYINRGFEEGDLVAYSDSSIIQVFFYLPNIPRQQFVYFFIESKLRNSRYSYEYLKEFQKSRLQIARDSNINIINLEESGISGTKSFKDLEFKRVWLISSSWERDGKLDGHVSAVREFMQSHYYLLDSKEFDGVFVDLYCQKND